MLSPVSPGSPRKRVSFGPYISPEYIDKHLPPSSPVRKGATPTPNSSGSKKKKGAGGSGGGSSGGGTPRGGAPATPSSLLKHVHKKAVAAKKVRNIVLLVLNIFVRNLTFWMFG